MPWIYKLSNEIDASEPLYPFLRVRGHSSLPHSPSLCLGHCASPSQESLDLSRPLCKPAGGGEGISCWHRPAPLPFHLSSPKAHLRLLSAPFIATPALSWALPAPPARVCIWSCRKPRATLPASSVTGSGARAGGRRRQRRACREEGSSGRSRLCITEAGTGVPQQVRLERGGPGEMEWGGRGRGACLGSGRALPSCAPRVGWEMARKRGRKAQGPAATQM